MNRLFMIGNTHFDPSWLWTWDEAMASIRSTFRSVLERMKEDPDFIYSFSAPAVFEWIEQVDPDLFEEIRVRVQEGRWDVRAVLSDSRYAMSGLHHYTGKPKQKMPAGPENELAGMSIFSS